VEKEPTPKAIEVHQSMFFNQVPNLGFLPYPKCLHTNPHDKCSGFEMVQCTKMKQHGVSVLYIVEWNGNSS
jgi:hypothetical protein